MALFAIMSKRMENGLFIALRTTRRSNQSTIVRLIWTRLSIPDRLDIEFELKNRVLATLLKRIYGEDLSFVVCFNEIGATDSHFTVAGLDSVILHATRRICRCAINEAELKGDRRGNVSHTRRTVKFCLSRTDHGQGWKLCTEYVSECQK